GCNTKDNEINRNRKIAKPVILYREKPQIYTPTELDHGHLDPIVFQGILGKLGNTAIGNDLIDMVEAANPSKAPFAEFGGIGQNYRFLGDLDHFPVQMGLHDIGCGQAEVQVDDVHAQIKFAACKIWQYGFRIKPR